MNDKFPFEFEGKVYYEKDCDKIFLQFYEGWFSLTPEGCYVAEGIYILPNGKMN